MPKSLKGTETRPSATKTALLPDPAPPSPHARGQQESPGPGADREGDAGGRRARGRREGHGLRPGPPPGSGPPAPASPGPCAAAERHRLPTRGSRLPSCAGSPGATPTLPGAEKKQAAGRHGGKEAPPVHVGLLVWGTGCCGKVHFRGFTSGTATLAPSFLHPRGFWPPEWDLSLQQFHVQEAPTVCPLVGRWHLTKGGGWRGNTSTGAPGSLPSCPPAGDRSEPQTQDPGPTCAW